MSENVLKEKAKSTHERQHCCVNDTPHCDIIDPNTGELHKSLLLHKPSRERIDSQPHNEMYRSLRAWLLLHGPGKRVPRHPLHNDGMEFPRAERIRCGRMLRVQPSSGDCTAPMPHMVWAGTPPVQGSPKQHHGRPRQHLRRSVPRHIPHSAPGARAAARAATATVSMAKILRVQPKDLIHDVSILHGIQRRKEAYEEEGPMER
jgi:hypothetical protein